MDTALRLARYFHTTPQFWLNLQMHYDLEMARETRLVDRVNRDVRENEALRGAVRLGRKTAFWPIGGQPEASRRCSLPFLAYGIGGGGLGESG